LESQDGALKLFGFNEFTIPLVSAAEIAGSYESVGIIGAKNAGLSVESFVIDGFSFSETGGGVERIGEIGFDGERVGVIRAEDMGARGESLPLKFFGFVKTAKFLECASEI